MKFSGRGEYRGGSTRTSKSNVCGPYQENKLKSRPPQTSSAMLANVIVGVKLNRRVRHATQKMKIKKPMTMKKRKKMKKRKMKKKKNTKMKRRKMKKRRNGRILR